MTVCPPRPARAASGFRLGRLRAALPVGRPVGWQVGRQTLLRGGIPAWLAANVVCTALLGAPALAADPVTPAQRASAQQDSTRPRDRKDSCRDVGLNAATLHPAGAHHRPSARGNLPPTDLEDSANAYV